ncbi:MAG: Holliday junction branch migration protein RuvA, partial [Planctomycetota bacterium]
MYDFLEGTVDSCTPTLATLNVGGVGYRLLIPVSTYERMREARQQDQPIRVLTYLQMLTQQDEMRLYGFASQGERSLFLALIKVQGIGPVSALSVLSAASPTDVVRAIQSGDAKFFRRVKGVGKKTAERLLIELKEKAHQLLPAEAHATPVSSTADDAVRALMSLGYTPAVARKAVDKGTKELGPDA